MQHGVGHSWDDDCDTDMNDWDRKTVSCRISFTTQQQQQQQQYLITMRGCLSSLLTHQSTWTRLVAHQSRMCVTAVRTAPWTNSSMGPRPYGGKWAAFHRQLLKDTFSRLLSLPTQTLYITTWHADLERRTKKRNAFPVWTGSVSISPTPHVCCQTYGRRCWNRGSEWMHMSQIGGWGRLRFDLVNSWLGACARIAVCMSARVRVCVCAMCEWCDQVVRPAVAAHWHSSLVSHVPLLIGGAQSSSSERDKTDKTCIHIIQSLYAKNVVW